MEALSPKEMEVQAKNFDVRVAEKLKADKKIVEIADRFHDIDYSRGKDFHTLDSALMAKDFLLKHGYPHAQLVYDTILCHSTATLKQRVPHLEDKIL